jgi:hypothetical protein
LKSKDKVGKKDKKKVKKKLGKVLLNLEEYCDKNKLDSVSNAAFKAYYLFIKKGTPLERKEVKEWNGLMKIYRKTKI